MSKLKQVILFTSAALIAIAAGIFLRVQFMDFTQSEITTQVSKQGADAIFAATLPDLDGEQQALSQWEGNVLVVNFWATWCEPCREEIPEFVETQEKFRDQGLVFLGIAYDREEMVTMFSKEFSINYPVLLGGLSDWKITEAAGNVNSVLPYTAVINHNGEIVKTYLGRVNQEKLEALIIPLLRDRATAASMPTT